MILRDVKTIDFIEQSINLILIIAHLTPKFCNSQKKTPFCYYIFLKIEDADIILNIY